MCQYVQAEVGHRTFRCDSVLSMAMRLGWGNVFTLGMMSCTVANYGARLLSQLSLMKFRQVNNSLFRITLPNFPGGFLKFLFMCKCVSLCVHACMCLCVYVMFLLVPAKAGRLSWEPNQGPLEDKQVPLTTETSVQSSKRDLKLIFATMM